MSQNLPAAKLCIKLNYKETRIQYQPDEKKYKLKTEN